jgi:hypothetical protein
MTVSVSIRYGELDPTTESYLDHLKVWNRERELLNGCITAFNSKGCGPDDPPPEFEWKKAEHQARRPAPRVTGPRDFLRRGGWVPIVIMICAVCPECCAISLPEPATGPAPAPETGGSSGGGGITEDWSGGFIWGGGDYVDDDEFCAYCPECCEDDPDPMEETCLLQVYRLRPKARVSIRRTHSGRLLKQGQSDNRGCKLA